MSDINTIINSMLPSIIIAVIVGSLITVSTEGIKNFLNVELNGNIARVVTVAIAAFWSWSLVMFYGNGTLQDCLMVFVMSFMGATGIYEIATKITSGK